MTSFYPTATTLRQGARPLPGHYYTCETIFAEEMEKIFGDRWLYIAHVDEIPHAGDYVVRTVHDESFITIRDAEGQIHAFYNVCRHRGSRLCTKAVGHLKGLIRCPYHAWGFDWDGQLRSAPFMEDVAGFERADFPLQQGAIAVLDGMIFLNLSPQPEPFAQAFAPVLQRFTAWDIANLKIGHQTEYTIQANWKLVIQNYSECYHCSGVHPELVKFSAASTAANDFFRGSILGGPMRLDPAYTSLSMTGQRTLPVLGTVTGDDLQHTYYYLLFPNLLLSLQPDYVMIHHVQPVSVTTTQVTCTWLIAPNVSPVAAEALHPIVELWERVNQQDWQVCEGMQAGIRSRSYTPSFYSGQESLLPEIDQEVLRSLGHSSRYFTCTECVDQEMHRTDPPAD